jgi:hypothetical protein
MQEKRCYSKRIELGFPMPSRPDADTPILLDDIYSHSKNLSFFEKIYYDLTIAFWFMVGLVGVVLLGLAVTRMFGQ